GEVVTFTARLFDASGNLLKETPAKWSLPTPTPPPGAKTNPPPLRGEIADGKLTVSKDVPGQHGYVEAAAERLTARTRGRVVPPIPVQQDFEKVPVGAFPGGWVNTQGKYAVVERDGNKVLKKFANDSRPPLARANAYFGLPEWKDYTIEADLLGTRVRGNLP